MDCLLQTEPPSVDVLHYIPVVNVTESAILNKAGFSLGTFLKPVEEINHQVFYIKT